MPSSDPSKSPSGAASGGTWHVHLGKRRVGLGRSGTLAVSRVVDTGVLGLCSVVLAWRLGIHGFVPVSALLVVNSLSVVGSDFGLGTEVLRSKVGGLSPRSAWSVRIANLVIAVVVVMIGVALQSAGRTVVIGGGLIWAVSAEAFIRKSALLRLGRARRAAIGEMTGSAVLASGLVTAVIVPSSALVIMVGSLVGKHLIESLVNRGWQDAFDSGGDKRWELWLWLNSLLNFSISNVDFVLVAALLSSRAFAIYSIGFRIAAAFVAQFSYVVNRVSLVDFGDAVRGQALDQSYRRRRGQMFKFGLASGVITALFSPVLFLMGSQWHDTVGVVLVLACAIPWRMCSGLGLNALLAAGGARQAAAWEASRLVVATPVLSVATIFGFGAFTLAAALVAIATAVGYDRIAVRAGGGSGRSWLVIGSPIALGLAGCTAWIML